MTCAAVRHGYVTAGAAATSRSEHPPRSTFTLDETSSFREAELGAHGASGMANVACPETKHAGRRSWEKTESAAFRAITAAKCLVAWSPDGRVRNEAAFACLAGVNPIPASLGNTVRHRLNRGKDRRLNSALHTAAVSRMTHDARTCDYVEKRRAEGKTDKEIRRCVKCYLGRRVFRILDASA